MLVWSPVDRGIDVCPLHAATGLDCPLCGATRASWFLLHGDLGAALRSNVLLLPLLAWVTVLWLHASWPERTARLHRLVTPAEWPRGVAVLGVAGLLVFTVARNLPGGEWLAPVPT